MPRAWRDTDAGPSGATGLASPRWDCAGILTDFSAGGVWRPPAGENMGAATSPTPAQKRCMCVCSGSGPSGCSICTVCTELHLALRFGTGKCAMSHSWFNNNLDSLVGIAVISSLSIGLHAHRLPTDWTPGACCIEEWTKLALIAGYNLILHCRMRARRFVLARQEKSCL